MPFRDLLGLLVGLGVYWELELVLTMINVKNLKLGNLANAICKNAKKKMNCFISLENSLSCKNKLFAASLLSTE